MLLKASLHKDLSSITLIKGYIRITLITHSSEREFTGSSKSLVSKARLTLK